MNESSFIKDIALSVTAAAAIGIPAYFFRLPLVLAYIAAGILIGPHFGLGWVRDSNNISSLAEIGMVMLMFILGLEINIPKALQFGRVILVNGIVQFLITAFFGYGIFGLLAPYLALTPLEVILLSVSASLSSTLLVVKFLSERMEIHSNASRITLGILVIQDLWAVTYLSILPSLSQPMVGRILSSIGASILLLLVAWTIARFIIPKLFSSVQRQPELLLILALSWCFLIATVAHQLHLSLEMGALIAGTMISSFPHHADLASKVASLRDFFITLFFVALGLQIEPLTHESVILTVTLVCFALVSRGLVVFPGLLAFKQGFRGSLLPTLNLAQLSEFSLIFASLAISYGQISRTVFSAVVLAFAISSLISSIIIPNSHKIFQWVQKMAIQLGLNSPEHSASQPDQSEKLLPKIIMLGFFRDASSLVEEWRQRHTSDWLKQVMVVDLNVGTHFKLRELGIMVHYGDITNRDSLKSLYGIESAQFIVCTLPERSLRGLTPLNLLRTLRMINPNAKIILTAETIQNALELYNEGAHYVILHRITNAKYLADRIDVMNLGQSDIREEAIQFLKSRIEILP